MFYVPIIVVYCLLLLYRNHTVRKKTNMNKHIRMIKNTDRSREKLIIRAQSVHMCFHQGTVDLSAGLIQLLQRQDSQWPRRQQLLGDQPRGTVWGGPGFGAPI